MLSHLTALCRKAIYVYQKKGLIELLNRLIYVTKSFFFHYGRYYLYEHTIRPLNEADFLPAIPGLVFKIVSTNQEADVLASAGLEFRADVPKARLGLDQGATAFCFFIRNEIAHIGWVAMSYPAKNTFDSLPYTVDFAHRQVCTGGTWTNPKYRGKGLMAYGYFKRFQFLQEKGIISSRNAVGIGNLVSQKAHARFNPRIYARARYLKILFWKSWQETPIV